MNLLYLNHRLTEHLWRVVIFIIVVDYRSCPMSAILLFLSTGLSQTPRGAMEQVASMDSGADNAATIDVCRSQAKQILKRLNPRSAAKCSIESRPYMFQ